MFVTSPQIVARALIYVTSKQISSSQWDREWASYTGRERVVLRKRRTKVRVDHFHIITQVGQGGYGEVFLARKNDSGEVCALKKMKKRTLFKMDEVSKSPFVGKQRD